MTIFQTHTIEDAPEASRELLQKAKGKLGFVPNMLGVLAESPTALGGYLTLAGILEQSSFKPTERQILLLAIAREDGCEYCVAAHSAGALKSQAQKQAIHAIRNDKVIDERRLGALHAFCKAVVAKRGRVPESEVTSFLRAGFTKGQVLEVVLAVALKTLSSYVNHIADTPLDPAFQSMKWTNKSKAA
jgi:uncharacterized peroxidase-related enzyme